MRTIMDGAGDQFLSRACFTQNKHGRVRLPDFSDLLYYLKQRLRRANNFFKHRRAVHLLKKSDILALKPILNILAVVDVGTSGVPSSETSVSITDGVKACQKPSVISVTSSKTDLDFKCV